MDWQLLLNPRSSKQTNHSLQLEIIAFRRAKENIIKKEALVGSLPLPGVGVGIPLNDGPFLLPSFHNPLPLLLEGLYRGPDSIRNMHPKQLSIE